MATQVSMFYGGYEFTPVPFVSINKNYLKTADGISRGVTFALTLTGTLTAMNEDSGLATLIAKQRELREAFNQDGKYFKIVCGEETILECYPRVLNLSFTESNNNWVFTTPYTLNIEYENDPADEEIDGSGEDNGLLHPEYIADFQESWSVEFSPEDSNPFELCNETNPYVLRVSHNLSAVGKSHYSGPGTTGTLDMPAWQQAASYISGYLGFNTNELYNHGVLNISGLSWTPYDHLRVVNKNTTAGSYDVQESWLVLSSGNVRAIEDFTIDVNIPTLEEYSTISIQGSIRGLEERTYGLTGMGSFDITGYKYNNALAYYNSIEPSLLTRVQCAASEFGVTPVNIQPLVRVVGQSPNQGTVTYSQTYNTRPSNCIAGSRYENIDIADKNPNDVFTLIPIIGRSTGPIIQGFNTVTEFSRTLNVEVGVAPATGCSVANLLATNPKSDVYNAFIQPFYADLTGTYDKVKTASDNENWSPKFGRYTRSVTWTAVDCP